MENALNHDYKNDNGRNFQLIKLSFIDFVLTERRSLSGKRPKSACGKSSCCWFQFRSQFVSKPLKSPLSLRKWNCFGEASLFNLHYLWSIIRSLPTFRGRKIDFSFIWQNWIQTFNLTIYSLRNCLVYGRSCRNYSLKSFVSFGNNFVKFRGKIEMLFTSLSRSVFGKTVPCVLSTARGLLLLSGTVFPNTDLPAGE